jgi:hypothetical protein
MVRFEAAVYFLCFLGSGLCAYLLVSSFRRRREKLLWWSAICFCLLAGNNLLVFVDLILLPQIDLIFGRALTSLFAVAALLYGFVWEVE